MRISILINRAKILFPPANPCLDRAKKFNKIGNTGTMDRVITAQFVDTIKMGLARAKNVT